MDKAIRMMWPAEGTMLTFYVCLFSVLATPIHHHGHSCLRLRVFVCCSTGETTLLTLASLLMSVFRSTNRETKSQKAADRERNKEDLRVVSQEERGREARAALTRF